jgi:hypothetical protein
MGRRSLDNQPCLAITSATNDTNGKPVFTIIWPVAITLNTITTGIVIPNNRVTSSGVVQSMPMPMKPNRHPIIYNGLSLNVGDLMIVMIDQRLMTATMMANNNTVI